MSGGLLEKAKEKSEDLGEGVFSATGDPDNPEFKEEKKVLDAETSGSTGGGLLSKASSGPGVFSSWSDKPLFLYGAVFTLILSMILIHFMYLITAGGYLALAVLIGSGFLASQHIKNSKNGGESLRPMQWGALVVVYLLLGGIPYVAGMEFGGSLLLSDAEVTMDENTGASIVTVNLRHSAGLFGSEFTEGDVDIKVKQSGCEAWTDIRSVSLDQKGVGDDDYGIITLMVSDFYCNNALQIDGVTSSGGPVLKEVPYVVTVTLDGASASITLPTFELTKSITDVDERAKGHITDQNCPNNDHATCIDYIHIQGWVGEGTDEPPNNASIPARINGQYDINMNFVHMDSDTDTIENYNISVVGTAAEWDERDIGCGQSNASSMIGDLTTEFFFMCDGNDYFENDIALSEGYGCYSLTVTALQNGTEVSSSTSYYLYEDKEEHSDGDPAAQPPVPAGTVYWEEFNEDPTCASS